MRLVMGDRASAECLGKRIDVGAIAEAGVRAWVRDNLRYVDHERHLVFQNELKEGSPELTDIFERETVGANDTSAAVGYAPLTETERLVLAAERWLNSPDFQRRFPEAGEDVKVMGVRRDRELTTDGRPRLRGSVRSRRPAYFRRKEEIRLALTHYLAGPSQTLDRVDVQLNTLDDPARGEGGMYLTVLGTSAEGADCGQVGRGNRVNGVIPLNRPISTEAAAGKNPVSHVGKIYSLADPPHRRPGLQAWPGVAEVYVWLCSQIGQPLNAPLIAAAQVILQEGVGLPEVSPPWKRSSNRNCRASTSSASAWPVASCRCGEQ